MTEIQKTAGVEHEFCGRALQDLQEEADLKRTKGRQEKETEEIIRQNSRGREGKKKVGQGQEGKIRKGGKETTCE